MPEPSVGPSRNGPISILTPAARRLLLLKATLMQRWCLVNCHSATWLPPSPAGPCCGCTSKADADLPPAWAAVGPGPRSSAQGQPAGPARVPAEPGPSGGCRRRHPREPGPEHFSLLKGSKREGPGVSVGHDLASDCATPAGRCCGPDLIAVPRARHVSIFKPAYLPLAHERFHFCVVCLHLRCHAS